MSAFPFLVVGSAWCRGGSLFLVSRKPRETLASRHSWNRESLSNRHLQRSQPGHHDCRYGCKCHAMTSSRDHSLQPDKKDFHTNVFELMSSSFRFLQRKKAIIIYCVDSDKINHRDALTWGSVFSLIILCFLVDKDRQLCCVDLKQVTSQARQSNSTSPLTELTSQAIEKITNCHLFAIGQVRKW